MKQYFVNLDLPFLVAISVSFRAGPKFWAAAPL
jgi:hypothetical protein